MPALVVNEYIHVRRQCLSQNDRFNNVGEIANINVFEKHAGKSELNNIMCLNNIIIVTYNSVSKW